ncbi:hypothetical protein KPL37_17540 [Clostridium frigoris]|uniref:Uncharacterized protein n=1 Tax=Clostridium frigoris TaxID=205327 RepID=A0ABS6BY29_9CLOT|nr:hypothetical protein [Clostridium frigoris]MBU3161513.1 hypothetical protein [Clostridium frigoris]
MYENNLEKIEKSNGISNDDSMNKIADDIEPRVMGQSSTDDLVNEVNEIIMKNEMNMF